MRRALLVVAAAGLLSACAAPGDGAAPTGRSTPEGRVPSATPTPGPSPTSTPTSTPSGPRVDSALCDDLRDLLEVRRGAPALTDPSAEEAASAAVAAAARRVLVAVGSSGVLPETVATALQDYASQAPPDDARDAVVRAYAEEQCPR